jgi:hypothetical protein
VTRILHFNTHGERRYFLGQENRELYDLIGLNGNIVSHSPAGVAAFLATVAKDFYIDPQTHAFQHATTHLKRKVELDNGTVMAFKPSVEKLAKERLGEPFASVISNDRPLTPRNFLDSHGKPVGPVIRQVCEKIAKFQDTFLADSIDEETREYMDDESALHPKFIVAPYFYLSPASWIEWLTVNIAFYNQAKASRQNRDVYLALVMPQGLLGESKRVCDRLQKEVGRIDGILLWIDDHDEEALSSDQALQYVNLLEGLRSSTSVVLNTHGGYLSCMLCHEETGPLLSGVGQAPNYGESRGVVPVGGGLPRARFYLQKAHSRLRFAEAASILVARKWLSMTTTYRDKVCKCQQCDALIRQHGNAEKAFYCYGESNVSVSERRGTVMEFEYPTAEAKEIGIWHYLYNKNFEFASIGRQSFQSLVDALLSDHTELAEDPDSDYLSYLKVWNQALKDRFLQRATMMRVKPPLGFPPS